MKDVDPGDLQFKEFATYARRALQLRGYSPAPEGNPAEVVIFLSYGIGDPKTTYYSYPILGQVGGGSSSFSASTYGAGGSTQTTGTITSAPRVGIVGTGVGAGIDFFRWAIVEAVDVEAFARTQQVVQLWRTTMTSRGWSGDLRRIFPVLLAAGTPFLATNTGQQLERFLTDSTPGVVSIRGERNP